MQPDEQHPVGVVLVAGLARVLVLNRLDLVLGEVPEAGEALPVVRLQVISSQVVEQLANVAKVDGRRLGFGFCLFLVLVGGASIGGVSVLLLLVVVGVMVLYLLNLIVVQCCSIVVVDGVGSVSTKAAAVVVEILVVLVLKALKIGRSKGVEGLTSGEVSADGVTVGEHRLLTAPFDAEKLLPLRLDQHVHQRLKGAPRADVEGGFARLPKKKVTLKVTRVSLSSHTQSSLFVIIIIMLPSQWQRGRPCA